MFKRILMVLLISSLFVSLTSCAQYSNDYNSGSENSTTQTSDDKMDGSVSEELPGEGEENSSNSEKIPGEGEEGSSNSEELPGEGEDSSNSSDTDTSDEGTSDTQPEVEDTPYTVKYYKNSLSNELEYQEIPEMEEVLYGVAGKQIELTSYFLKKYIPGFVYNNVDSVDTGIVMEDGSLVLHAYYEINRIDVSNYEEFRQSITFYPNAYILLLNDIDPVAEYGVREEIWEMPEDPFIGVIDGQGFSIKNITLYNYTPPQIEHIAMFDEFRGELKNIGFDYIRSVPTYSGENNGNIARRFSGKAENVYFYGAITKTRVDSENIHYGGMFGVLEDGASIKNCYIELQCTDKSNCSYDYGYLAGVIAGKVEINNIVVSVSNLCEDYGKFIARYLDEAEVNNRKVLSNSFISFYVNMIMGSREENIQKAARILGDAWVCDGVNVPRLKTVYEL